MTKQNANTLQSQSDIAIRIERLINAIQRTDSQACRISYSKHGDEQVRETMLSKYFDGIVQMVALLDGDVAYQYSWHLSLLQEACQAIGIERSPFGISCLNEGETRYLSTSETLNELTKCIRTLLAKRDSSVGSTISATRRFSKRSKSIATLMPCLIATPGSA